MNVHPLIGLMLIHLQATCGADIIHSRDCVFRYDCFPVNPRILYVYIYMYIHLASQHLWNTLIDLPVL